MDADTLPTALPTPHRVLASELLGAGGPLSAVITSPEVRPTQLAMADAVQHALETPGTRLVVEAPTGTGKSLAYLLAAAVARRGGDPRPLRVVVATGTRNLQDQLALVDAPRALAAMQRAGLPAPIFEVVKGRRNYLCLHRLAAWQPPLLSDAPARMVKALRIWSDQTEVGDRAEVPDLPDDSPLWGELDADGDACLGTACSYHQPCFVTRLRQRAREATIVITNHHLLCADLRLRFTGGVAEARVLPAYDALVIDEAHKLPGVAAEHFGLSVGPARIESLCRDALRLGGGRGQKHPAVLGAVGKLQRESMTLWTRVAQALANVPDASRVQWSVRQEEVVEQAAVNVLGALQDSTAQLEALGAAERDMQLEAEALGRRMELLQAELTHLVQAHDERFAFCAERRGQRGRLMAYPADVSEVLRNSLLAGPEPVVFTSATLAVNGDFTATVSDLGMVDGDDPKLLALPSTFSASQAALYVPRDLPDPDSPVFLEQAGERIAQLVELVNGGAFLLCTTNRAMNHYAQVLGQRLERHLVLRQGDAPKPELLARFKADGNAVLVATHSFWEGVDVRGRALRTVIIDKLPFAPPADPIVNARMQRAEREGRRPFEDVQLADAILLLRQGLGRLLRGREDRGLLVVMDGRLTRRGYGKRVLRSLGDHPTVHAWDELVAEAERLGVRA